MLSEQARFDPATARRCFRIAAINYVQVMLLATLLKRLATTVPMIDFEIRQASVEAGVLDLLIRPHRQVAGSFGRRFTTTVTSCLDRARGETAYVVRFCRDGACLGCAARTPRRDRR